jgi:hypothetical protein
MLEKIYNNNSKATRHIIVIIWDQVKLAELSLFC